MKRLLNAIDALDTGLSIYLDARETLPVVSVPAAGQNAVRPSAVESAKLRTVQAITYQGIKRTKPLPPANWVGTGHKLIAYLTCGTLLGPTK